MRNDMSCVWFGIITGIVLVGISFVTDPLVAVLGILMAAMNIVVNVVEKMKSSKFVHHETEAYSYRVEDIRTA